MKRFVKIISLVLTLAMVFSVMSIGAWADDNNTPAEQTKTVPVNVEKVWVDNNNASGKRPVAISVVLKTGEKVVKDLELSAKDGWKTQIELPANFDWTSSLTVEETTSGPDYLTDYKDSITVVPPSADGFTIEHSCKNIVHNLDDVEMIILKKGNSYCIWTSKQVVDLVSKLQGKLNGFNLNVDNTVIVENQNSATFGEGNDTATIVNENGKVTLAFSAHSTWAMFAYGNAEAVEEPIGRITITNTYNPQVEPEKPTTSVTVNKVWYDADNFDKLRPESVTVQLYANSEEYGKPVTLNKENDWKCTWTGLPVATEDGKAIEYAVDEVKVPEGYEKNIRIVKDTADGFGFVIENTHTPTSYVEFPITKVVKQGGNVAPGKETFTFEAFVMTDNGKQSLQTQTITTNGVETKGQYFTIEKSMLENGVFVREVKGSSEGWTYDEQLWLVKPAPQPKSVDDEVLIEQMNLQIFKVEIKDTDMDPEEADEIVFTNTYTKNTVKPPVQEYDPEPTPKDKVVVKKVWVGDDEKTRPEEITVQLYKNGKKYEKPVKLSADEDIYENWRHVWDDVREDEDTVWSVKELNVPDGYSVSIEQRRSNYFIITNTLNEKPNPDTGASDFVGAAVALAVCSAVSGAALMLKRK